MASVTAQWNNENGNTMRQSRRLIKRIAIFSAGLVLVLAALIVTSLLFPRFMTGLFFGVDTAPVELAIRETFDHRESDAKTTAIADAASIFLASLDSTQKEAATYAFSDNEQRSRWSNFPEGMIPRGGLKLGTLSEKQQALLDILLAKIMSERGVLNLNYQLAAEETLAEASLMRYGIQHFYVAFLGEPSSTQPWMFQFGGHHLAINVTIYGADITFSPMLTGGQPLHIHYDGTQIFVTEEEAAAAQALMDSLTPEQKKTAIRSDKAIDLLSGPGEYGTVVAPEGIRSSDLSSAQKQLLIALIDTRLGLINDDDHAAAMAAVSAEIDDTYFGWWGPQDQLGFAYFRVTGPSLVLEYSPQDDAGATLTNHAHSMYRNPRNDYGAAWIGQ